MTTTTTTRGACRRIGDSCWAWSTDATRNSVREASEDLSADRGGQRLQSLVGISRLITVREARERKRRGERPMDRPRSAARDGRVMTSGLPRQRRANGDGGRAGRVLLDDAEVRDDVVQRV